MIDATRSPTRVVALFACLVGLLAVAGCGNLQSDYGQSKGSNGRKSLNGFGGLRRGYELAGFKSRDVTRLTQRVRRSDVIVWTPQELGPIPADVTTWLDAWLAQGNRTLVYVVPDSGSEVDYWRETADLAPPEQRLEYRKRAARATNQRLEWQLNRRSVSSNGWFMVSPNINTQKGVGLSGPWLPPDTSSRPDLRDGSITTEFKVSAYKEQKPTAAPAATGTTPAPAPAGGGNAGGGNAGGGNVANLNPNSNVGPTGPNSLGWTSMATTTVQSKADIQFKPVVIGDDQATLIAAIESDRWRRSKVIVVSSGSMLTNYALSKPIHATIAQKLIATSRPFLSKEDTEPPKVGFLTTDWRGIAISEATPGAPNASGMELLTVWPINLVTIHGVLLGLVVCLMLFPIFGRPRKLRRVNHSDFGDHLDAVASLMSKAGGEHFAKHRISEYFKRIRGETAGPWVMPDTQKHESITMHGVHPDQSPTQDSVTPIVQDQPL